MCRRRLLYLYCLIICCDTMWSLSLSSLDNSGSSGRSLLSPVNFTYKHKLIDYTSRIFCNSQVKVVNVFFENETSLSYPGQILKILNDCGISHVSIRNKFRKRPLKILKDDGILMYLLMILRDITQDVQFQMIRKKSASKYLTYIILMIDESESITDSWLHKIFQGFWKLWILNVAIVYYRHGKLQIYRYDPFLQKLFPETISDNYHHVTVKDLFPDQMLNMRLKPLRMCMYNDGVRTIFTSSGKLLGTDGLMSGYLAERLNATRLVNQVKAYGNTSISRDICFKEIVEEIDEVSVNIRFLSLDSFRDRAEHTIVHRRDDLCVMVPKAKIASTFWNLFRSFNDRVWLLILLTLLLAYGFCVLNYRQRFSKHKLLLQLYASIISMPFAQLRRPESLRIFLCVWLLYGMLISAAFKGNLTGNLVDRQYLPDLNTIKELAESPYLLATLPRHMKHLHRYIDPTNYHGALLKLKVVETPDLQFQKLLDSNNVSYAYLMKKHLSMFRANSRNHTLRGIPLFHVMRQCIVPFHAVYIVPYGSPYLGFINTLVRNAQEFGFINYWDSIMNEAFRTSRKSVIRQRLNDDEPQVLELYHFEAVFFLLFLGLTLAFLCFLSEIWGLRYIQKLC